MTSSRKMLLSMGLLLVICSCLRLEIANAAPLTRESNEALSQKKDKRSEHSHAFESKTKNSIDHDDKSIGLEMKPKSAFSKRDLEQEADSANGKTPYYIYKKNEPNLLRYLTFANENGFFTGYPEYTGSQGIGAGSRPRSRRSYESDAISLPLMVYPPHTGLPTDEIEVQLEKPEDKETLLKLMALLSPKDSNYNNNLFNDDVFGKYYKPLDVLEDEGFHDEYPIDLGYYGPTDLLNKFPPAHGPTFSNLPKVDLNEIANAGLYFSPKQIPEETDDDWTDAIPLQTHFKTGRSDLTSYNPTSMIFRRPYRSSFDGMNYNEEFGKGKFGNFYPQRDSIFLRKRRSFNANVKPYSM